MEMILLICSLVSSTKLEFRLFQGPITSKKSLTQSRFVIKIVCWTDHVLCGSEPLLVGKGKWKSHKGQICSECFLPQNRELLTLKLQSCCVSCKEISLADVYWKYQLLGYLQKDGCTAVSRIGLVWGENGRGPVWPSGWLICRKPVSMHWNSHVHVTQSTGEKEEQL